MQSTDQASHQSGRTAIVTGAAQGMGRTIVEALSAAGADVVLADVQEEPILRLAGELSRGGGKAIALRTDITVAADVTAMAEACVHAFGRIDILVNVAGGATGLGFVKHPIEDMPEQDFRRIVEVNLHGAFLATRAVVPRMKAARYGRIVFISSVAGRTRSRGAIYGYAAGKAGSLGLMRDLAYELGPWGITVNSVAPGLIDGPLARTVWETMPETARESFLSELCVKRMGTPSEIAEAVLYFVSPGAAYTTGQTLIVDGGKVTY